MFQKIQEEKIMFKLENIIIQIIECTDVPTYI